MLQLNIINETARLRAVVLGTAESLGGVPKLEEAYDPKSREHILAGTYPKEADMKLEMDAFNTIFQKYDIKVFRPKTIENYNQIFSRDIGFVIDDFFIKANILPDREDEIKAIDHVITQIDPKKVLTPPEEVHVEGGDVMPWRKYLFVGTCRRSDYSDIITARTNLPAVDYLKKTFPDKIVKDFDLVKSNTDAKDNALHLDCCFQPIGTHQAIIYKEGFNDEKEYQFLVDLFGEENLFQITRNEMYQMNSNIFSIAPDVVVSEKNFTRLNNWLREQGFTVEEIPYAEISKQEGLLRCSTLPLIRD